MTPESRIQQSILREFATRRDLRLWRANAGVARIGTRRIAFGIKGQADLTGILPDGKRLEIEVKTQTGKQRPEQANYQAMIERFGGVYILARSVDDVYRALQSNGYDILPSNQR